MRTKNGCKLRKVMAMAAFGLALALSAGAAGDRLAISFSIWALYDMTPGGTFADPAKTMEELKRRGYNAIRLDDGAGLYAAPDGTPRGKVRIRPMFGEYSRKIRQQPVSEVREMDMRENLVRFCRAADACGMKVILSSWYYLHTNWMTDETINAQLFEGLSVEQKMAYFTDELCRILTILRENKLDRCIAFAELFNEFDGLYFAGDYGKIKDPEKVARLRSLHETAIARIKREHPGVKIAYDVWTPSTQKDLVPRNADVLNFHHYYYWSLYRDFEQGAVRNTTEEIPIPDGVRPYLVATPPTIADITATRCGNLRVGNDWNARVRLYAALDEAKIPALEKRLSDVFEKNRASYLQALRDGVARIGKIRDEVLPGVPIVMGEGGSYCAANALQFEEHSDAFWAMLREQSKILREAGLWGTVPRTTSGPEDPSWNLRPDDLRRVNDLFRLGEQKKSDVAKKPCRIDVKPGESLTAVRDRVRALDAAQRADGVAVRLPPGTYVLPQALTLGKEDSGTEGAPVVWCAADPKDRPHLVGGDAIPASAFKPVADPELVARLDPEARGKVLETDISGIRFAWPKPQKIPCELQPPLRVPDVFAGGRRLALASFPSEGWSEIVKITDRGAGYGDRTLASALAQGVIKPEDIYGGTFVYREDRPSRWAAHPEVAIEGFWRYDWRNTIIYAKAIDPKAKTITLGAAHSYRLGQGNPAPRRWRALNVFEELNRPGRYTVDFAKRRLYVYPPAGFDGVGVCSSSDPLVRMKDVHDVVLKGLHFGRSAGSGLVLDGAERVTVSHCEFTDARQVAVAGENCRRCEVRTCDFHRLCGGGIRLSGGDRRTLEPGNNLIEDCLFHHWNGLSATATAVNVGGVGNAVRHCVMRDTSHQAAGISGNDCLFEYNVLSNICTGTDDAGAFYKGRNPSAQGNVLRYNYFRNIGRQEIRNGHGSCAVYFDDGDCGETVFGNVFENAGVAGFGNFAAVFSHGGHSNVVRNCLFLDCQRALGSGPWPQKRWAEFLKSDKDAFMVVTRLRKEVDITKPPYTTHYPCLVGFLDPQPDEYRWNAAYDNAFVNCPLSLPDAQGKLTKPGLVAGRWRTNETSVVVEGDPGFVNRAAGDLRLRSDSPIYRKIPGFQPIPFEKIGLLTPRESKCDRLQSYIHDLAAKDGRYVAEFNLGRTRTKACAPVTFRWRGEAGTQYAVSVNGHALGVVSGETCAVVAEAAHVGRDPNRLSIDVVAGCDTALTNENRIAVFITVPAEKGPRLSEREFLDHLALPIDTSDVREGARQFVRYVRENYRIEPEIRETQTRRLTGNDLGKALYLGKCAVDYRFNEVGVWYGFPNRRIQWQFNPTRNGYREWCFHLACFRLSPVLATYYVQSGDERAAETWRDVCLSFFEDEPLPDGDPGSDTNSWRSLDTAERMLHLMTDLPVFLKSPAITDEFLLVFFRSMWEHGYRLRTAHAGGGNWLTNEMTGLYRFSWVMPYFKESEEWRSYALARIVKELNGQVYPDGHQYELAGGYHACVARQFLRIPAVSRFAGTEPPAEVMSTVERMFEPYMVLARPDGRIPGLNDSGDASVVPFLSEGATLFPARQDMRWFASGGKEGRRPDWLSRPLPYAGAAVMRTSWAKDAIWAYMDCGPLGTAHQHEDKLNVLVFAYGHKMLSEGGFYDYDTSEMRKYVLSTRSHNTVRIDGRDQNRLHGYRWHPEDIAKKAEMEFRTTDALDVAAAKYAEPYAGDSKSGLVHERRLMFFKSVPGVSPFFAVIDRLSATDGKEHVYEQVWHLNDGKLDGLGKSAFLATYPGGSALAGLCSDAAAEIVDKAGQRTPELQGWDPGVWSRNNATPITTPVVCGRFAGSRRIVTVLQPLRKASEPSVRAVRASADSADKVFELELSDGRIVAFSE